MDRCIIFVAGKENVYMRASIWFPIRGSFSTNHDSSYLNLSSTIKRGHRQQQLEQNKRTNKAHLQLWHKNVQCNNSLILYLTITAILVDDLFGYVSCHVNQNGGINIFDSIVPGKWCNQSKCAKVYLNHLNHLHSNGFWTNQRSAKIYVNQSNCLHSAGSFLDPIKKRDDLSELIPNLHSTGFSSQPIGKREDISKPIMLPYIVGSK